MSWTPNFDVLNDLKSPIVVFALSSQYDYLFNRFGVTRRSLKAVRWLNMLSQLTSDSNEKLQKIVHSHFDAILHMMHKFQVCFGNVDKTSNQNQKKN